jgi:hypothetical protein
MSDWPPKKNAAFVVTFPIYDNDGDLVSGAAGLDSEVSKDGGVFADCTNEASEIGSSGIYTLTLTSTEMNADVVCTITKTTTTNAKTAVNVMYTATRQLVDLAFPNTSGRGMDVDASGGVEVGAFQAGAITAAAFGAGAIDAAAIATGAIDADAIAADAIGSSELAATAAAEIADAVWDEIMSGHLTDGSFGARLAPLRAGTAQAGAAGSITLDAGASATDDLYNDALVFIVSGTGAGQARLISDYVGSTKVASVVPNWATNPSSDSVFIVAPQSRADLALWLGVAPSALISGRIDANTQAMANDVITAAVIADNAIDAGAIAANAITSAKIASGAITAATFAANALDAAALAADAANEIADAILSRDIDQVEATAALHSLCTAVLKAVSRIRDNAGTLEVYRTDGATLHLSQTVTTDATAQPIDELTVGV